MQSSILVIITGGTIEALYNPEEGTPYFVPVPTSVKESCIPQALIELGFSPSTYDICPLTMKDSKKVTTDALDFILNHAIEKQYDKVVVVHGTDTMPIHARYLEDRLEQWGSEHNANLLRIVLTGAMQPLRDKHGHWRPQSDGWENLRRAMDDVKTQPPGVYIEMGKGPWKADQVDKKVSATDGVVRSSGFVDAPAERFRDESFD
jgi:L-asparaginase/Glu-tRNA(Gln) amidotransferase subunit D